jgi:hypothetical protein
VTALDFVSVIAILAAVIAAPFMLIAWLKNMGRPKEERVLPLKSTLFFVVPILVGMLAEGISTYIAQYRVAEFLDSLSPQYSILIDSKVVPNRSEILDALRHVGDLPAHHSHPTRIFNVTISDPPRQLLLWVARDSSDPHEYWVFFPSPSKLAFRAKLKTDIGHVRTTVFDGYQRSNQAMQRPAGRSAFPLSTTTTSDSQLRSLSPAVADLASR